VADFQPLGSKKAYDTRSGWPDWENIMSLTSFLLLAALAGAPGPTWPSKASLAPLRSTETQLSSGRASLKATCTSFDQAVSAIRTGSVPDGVRCLHVAARRGEPLALRALGLMRLRGEYLARDEQEAVALFHQAARRGDAESMYLLGEAFRRGIGVTAEPGLARFWLNRAAARGYVAPAA
jgi:TPR repeat protein